MVLEEQVYRMLVISGQDKFNRALEDFLPGVFRAHTRFAGSISQGRRMLAERVFDFVLVNSPLPDGAGMGTPSSFTTIPQLSCPRCCKA